jgi:hypothetical protein
MTFFYSVYSTLNMEVTISSKKSFHIFQTTRHNPNSLQFQHTAISWSPHIRYLGLVLDSNLLFTRHLHSVIHKATGTLLKLFPLLGRDSPLSTPSKLTLYKLLIRSVLTYAAPVWSNTSSSNCRQLQILQSKCLPVTGNYPRRTPIAHLHTALTLNLLTSTIVAPPSNASKWQMGFNLAFKGLNIEPIRDLIYRQTEKFFFSCPAYSNLLVHETGSYTLADLHRKYRKYIHKRTKHLLL